MWPSEAWLKSEKPILSATWHRWNVRKHEILSEADRNGLTFQMDKTMESTVLRQHCSGFSHCSTKLHADKVVKNKPSGICCNSFPVTLLRSYSCVIKNCNLLARIVKNILSGVAKPECLGACNTQKGHKKILKISVREQFNKTHLKCTWKIPGVCALSVKWGFRAGWRV